MRFLVLTATAGALMLAACSEDPITTPEPGFVTYAAVGDSATVAAELASFRVALGGALNAPNSAPADTGRREINWDGVPAALTNVDTFPATFFNANSKRGALYTGNGTGFRIDSTGFGGINATYPSQFRAFTPKKLFMPVGSNSMEVFFKRSGTNESGLVNGFGAVFSDVDRAGSAHIDFYGQDDQLLGSVIAPAPFQAGAQGFSFVGATFPTPMVAHVFIVSGDAALSGAVDDVTNGGIRDLVVMDDFIYGEPRPVQ